MVLSQTQHRIDRNPSSDAYIGSGGETVFMHDWGNLCPLHVGVPCCVCAVHGPGSTSQIPC